uniref:C3a anaphylatoxin chemotactic receptor n=1 Tax=Pelusios castaneus TaxID=367368 RepID=A0A8C8SD45_9SAUR
MSPLLSSNSTYKPDEPATLQYAPEIIGSLIILTLTFILGLLGNGLVIWVAGLKMKWTVNIVWFLHLAFADFLCCMSLPFSIAHLILHEHWPYGRFLCKIIPSAMIFNMFASVFLLTAIGIDRCLLVMKPVWCQNYRTVRLASMTCGCIWLLAFIMCCPAFLYRETVKDEHGRTMCSYEFGEHYMSDYVDDMYYGDDLTISSGIPLDEYSGEDPTLVPAGTYEGIVFTHQPLDKHPDFQTPVHTRASPAVNTTTSSNLLQSIISTILTASAGLTSSTAHPDSELAGPAGSSPNGGIFTTSHVLHSELSDIPDGFSSANTPGSLYNGTDLPWNINDFMPKRRSPATLVIITITRLVFGFLLPFSIMLACYTLIAIKMQGARFTKPRGKTRQVILVVMATFFVCWAPYHAVGVLYLLTTPDNGFWKAVKLWDHLSIALAYANSCINPLLYVFMGRDFRKKARQTIQGILEGAFSEEVTRSTSYSRNRTKTSAHRDSSSQTL